VKVLFASHTSRISGAEHSLLTLLGALPEDAVEPLVACPPGPLAEAVRVRGVRVATVTGAEGSLKLSLAGTPRAVGELAAEAVELRRLARRHRAEVVHANTLRAGLAATVAARLGGAPAVVAVRDCLPPGRVARVTQRALADGAAALVPNSVYTRDAFLARRARVRARVEVVPSPVDLARFDPGRYDRHAARTALSLADEDLALTVAAQLTPWKGQDDAIATVAALRSRGLPVRLLLAGGVVFDDAATRFDNRAFERRLHDLVRAHDLGERVTFLGPRDDVPAVLRATDLLLAPSWEEPFGRSIVEAMAMGVPVAATAAGGPRHIIRHGLDGLLLAPRDPAGWARAIGDVLEHRAQLSAMGGRAREAARRFGAGPLAAQTLAVYRAVLQDGRPG
jgi:glycosyltransferase involved in cell wall biosynthesis